MSKKHFITLAGLFILGCALMLGASLAKKHRTVIEWDGNPYKLENVNPVDAALARPYNKTIDKIGDVCVALAGLASFAAIAVAFFASEDKRKAFKTAVHDYFALAISVLYGNSVYRILKTVAGRIRPYMYFADPSQEGIAKGDFYRSWPSGHSSNAFIALGFLFIWFKMRHSDSRYKTPVLTVSLLLCITTMVLRLLSGNHFLTDVLSGAAIGFTISSAMAVLCYSIYGKEID